VKGPKSEIYANCASFRSHFDNYAVIWAKIPFAFPFPRLLLTVGIRIYLHRVPGKSSENHHPTPPTEVACSISMFRSRSRALIECYEVICIFVVYVENKISLLTLLNLFANENGNGKRAGKLRETRGKVRKAKANWAIEARAWRSRKNSVDQSGFFGSMDSGFVCPVPLHWC